MTSSIVIGTRGSKLALCQAAQVIDALRLRFAAVRTSVQVIHSEADRRSEASLSSLGRGLFVKTLEEALLDNRIDMAVHSLKDLPTEPVEGLTIVPVLQRADPRDAQANRWGLPVRKLPTGARIGTSSPRRTVQLRGLRPDLQYLPIRGNVETRLSKALGQDYDAVVVAAAGVDRLELRSQVAELLPPRVCTPAPGQGALAVEVRSRDTRLLETAYALQHQETAAAVEAERWVLRAAGSGCQLPIGALAVVNNSTTRLIAACPAADGNTIRRAETVWPANDPEGAGRTAFQLLLDQGVETGRLAREQA